jgi:hypothetical protein
MHRCLPLLKNRRKLDILFFLNVDPPKLLSWPFLLDTINNPNALNKSNEDTTRWVDQHCSYVLGIMMVNYFGLANFLHYLY